MGKHINHSTRNSMIPLILPSDKVVVDKKGIIKVNDIVVFKKNRRLIAHRVVYITPDKDGVVAKGDNNKKADSQIATEDILGKVKKIKRNGNNIPLNHVYFSQSTSYSQELKSVIKSLRKEKIDYVFLKGLPVHLFLFDKPPSRLYLDADILVKKGDLKKVKNILESFGFKAEKGKLYGKPVKNPTQINFFKDKDPFPVIIDLHLEPPLGFTKERSLNKLGPNLKKLSNYLFSNIREATIDKVKYNLLDKEALIAFLLAHLYHHNFNGAHRINFIAQILKKKGIDWNKVVMDTKKLGFQNHLYPALLLTRKYYKKEVPKNYVDKLKPKSRFKRLLAKYIAKTINPFNESGLGKERVKRLVFLYLLSDKNVYKRTEILFKSNLLKIFYHTIIPLSSN